MSDDADRVPLAVRTDTTDPVELWLIRLRPEARPRYLAMLYAFLDYSGYSVTAAIEAGRDDRRSVHETVKAFIVSLPDEWAEREFAYSALRAFFSRCRIYLPTDPAYAVGGRKEAWWLDTDR